MVQEVVSDQNFPLVEYLLRSLQGQEFDSIKMNIFTSMGELKVYTCSFRTRMDLQFQIIGSVCEGYQIESTSPHSEDSCGELCKVPWPWKLEEEDNDVNEGEGQVMMVEYFHKNLFCMKIT